ncbi:MAG: CPBP family intramembrane metalloprotease [Clostridia bacterium]|nr:CPBP family intramembrane metalloprotease [Clostridia bacterium]
MEPEIRAATTRRARRTFARVHGSVAVFFGVFLLTAFLLVLLLPKVMANTPVSQVVSTVLVYAVSLPLAACVFIGLPASPPPRGTEGGAAQTAKDFCMAIAAMYGGNWLSLALAALLGSLTGMQIVNPVEQALSTDAGWVITAAMAVLIAPLAEELFFRKLMIDRLRPYGEKTAILISALLFGCFHGNIHQFFYAFFIGLLFGYLYVRSGSLRRTWLLHALVNFFGGVVGPLVSRLMLGIELPDPQQAEDFMAAFGQALPAFVVSMLYVILCLGMAVAGVVLWVRELKKVKDRPLQADTEGLSRRQVVLCALFNVGTLAAVAGTLYMMLINLN